MQITISTTDLSEELWKEFAEKFCNWTPQVMTTDLSPNVLIDNPLTFTEAVKIKYYNPIISDIASFNLAEANELVNTKIKEANDELEAEREQASQNAEQIISFNIL